MSNINEIIEIVGDAVAATNGMTVEQADAIEQAFKSSNPYGYRSNRSYWD
jgi:hypothetical protein